MALTRRVYHVHLHHPEMKGHVKPTVPLGVKVRFEDWVCRLGEAINLVSCRRIYRLA